MNRKAWEPYVRDIAARMRLGHWDIEVSEEDPKSDDALASVDPWYGQHRATIRLANSFLTYSPEHRRYFIIHELVHCYFAHSDVLVMHDLGTATEKAWRLASEYGVDAVAQTIAQFMPLPPGDLDGPEASESPDTGSKPSSVKRRNP